MLAFELLDLLHPEDALRVRGHAPIAARGKADRTDLRAVRHGGALELLGEEAADERAQGGGAIINTSSMVSIYGQPSGVGYPTSKFAVNGLTRSIARELGRDNIRVNAVAPGVTRTDMVANLPEDMVKRICAPIPLQRMGEPQEVANAFLFLASDLASYVTGEILSVDGAAQT